jgi:hypothetical protein
VKQAIGKQQAGHDFGTPDPYVVPTDGTLR